MVYFRFDRPPGPGEYQKLKDTFSAYFGPQMRWDDPAPYELSDYSYYSTVILIAVLIALCASVNIAILYQYVLERRKQTLAVFMLCGCTKRRAFYMYMAEIVLLSSAGFLIGVVCWRQLLMPVLLGMFPFMSSLNFNTVYGRSFVLILLSLLLIAGFMCGRLIRSQSIAQIEKEGAI